MIQSDAERPNDNSTTEQTDEAFGCGRTSDAAAAAEHVARPDCSELERRLAESWPVEAWRDSHVVLAVSGGADSVALLRAMVALKVRAWRRGKALRRTFEPLGCAAMRPTPMRHGSQTLCERLGLPLEIGTSRTFRRSRLSKATAGRRPPGPPATTFCSNRPNGWVRGLSRPPTLPMTRSKRCCIEFCAAPVLPDWRGFPARRPLSPSVALVRPLLAVKRREIDRLSG